MSKTQRIILYISVFITGAAVLVIEILGTRVLAPFYGSTIFVWSSLITLTLGALALGYFVGGRLIDRYPYPLTLFVIVGIAAFFVFLPMRIDQWVLPLTDGLGIQWGPLAATLLLFAAPLFLLGMAGPMVIRLTSKDVKHSGSTAGMVFAIATVGSIVGALLAGFFLLPHFSVTILFNSTAAVLMLAAFIGAVLESRDKKKGSATFAAIMIFLAVAGFSLPKYYYEDSRGFQILHHEQSRYADLKVMDMGGVFEARCMFMDGMAQTCVSEGGTGASLDRYVLEIKNLSKTWPADTKILLLGLGGGAIVKELAPDFSLDAVELDPKIAELAFEYFDLRFDKDDSLIIADARNFLRQKGDNYDIIISDLYIGGTIPAHLYTKEMMELIKNRLSEKGVAVVNIAGTLQSDLVVSLVYTQNSVFSNVVVTADSADSAGSFTNILVHLSRSSDYEPENSRYYAKQALDLVGAKLVTDSQNPLDIMTITSVEHFFKNSKKNFGFAAMFSL